MKFFVTGNDATDKGLDLQFIKSAGSQGSKFTDKEQTLQQSFSVAKNVFRLFERGEINFVLIGLSPDVLFRAEQKDFTREIFDKNIQTLKNYIKLCVDNDAIPVAVILPVAPSAREYYRNLLNPLLNILNKLEQANVIKLMNFFDFNLTGDIFADEVTLTDEGATIISILLTLELNLVKIFPETEFARMSYNYFYVLSYIVNKELFHDVMNKVFSDTLAKLRRKDKIRIAFVTDHAATWCGDRLYNLFAQNPRFETTVFLCHGSESTLEAFRRGVTQFKMAGINVIGISNLKEKTPPQDIIFFLRPYVSQFSASFQFSAMTPQTLMIHIPYGIKMINRDNYLNFPIMYLAWKHFFVNKESYKFHDKKCRIGLPRGMVSGLPKLDAFFDDLSKFKFPWKMVRPDAKKIIWAPHHSFTKKNIEDIKSTFPYNYRFMYEFAKAHPETSWVVKPHPRLVVAAVESGIFPSAAAYEDYLRQWDDLPNAQVYNGGYYQAIFATSDGMIHDSISFIAEYQYTHKPMIYMLNSENEDFIELGKKILNVSYLVDGKNPDAITAALQKIFIEGNDPLKDERRKVFDEYLNYYKLNGMSASEFIFKAVAKELELK